VQGPSEIRGNLPGQAEPTIGGLRGFWRLLRRFVPYALVYWDKLLLRVIYRQAYAIIGVLGAMVTIRVVDDGLLARDAGKFFMWSALKVALSAHILVFITIYANVCHYVLLRLNITFKRLLFDHVQRMPLAFHQMRPVGENMFRINSDSEAATMFAASAVPEVLERIVELVTCVSLILALNRIVVGLLAVYITLYFLVSHVLVTMLYRAQQHMRRCGQRVSAILQESYSAFGISKALARERHERRRYFNRLTGLMRATLSFFAYLALWMEGAQLMQEALVTQISHVLICGYLVITGRMTTGEFIAVSEMIALVQGPLMGMIATLQRLRVDAVPAQRMLETLDIEPAVQDKPNAVVLDRPKGAIRFENVCFRYAPEGPDVIKDLCFQVEPGQKLAIVGVSGAGKTTIFNLLMRFCEPTRGRILIDDHDLRDLVLESYLERVSVVLQENFLFSATIRDNIFLGDPTAPLAALDDAIERAGLGSTIAALPDGLDTMLLEGGNLSMGQTQRIGLARAVLRDPRFLYLDEATSALDPATEEEIIEQLKEVERGRTCLVIAHHIVSVKDADEILVMESGELAQRGLHEDLIADQKGAYARLWAAERAKRGAYTEAQHA